ncbi:glycogen synthase GlgA [Roseovarius spongiae]|uniref:Glycogen synthase n=1 Tax=Roseovarius spongiae TaxID=2320272 RepID=A0A3A8AT85_9RHOB|nr:glycogen synthase GlgA [Roseovarius spongiae]RKF12628.1 glycogen synthase GlgA [Roseovarius spongiae]
MKVLSVTSEMYPLAKTGGLADVCGALPGALARQGVDMRVLLPAYPGARELCGPCAGGVPLGLPLGTATLRRCEVAGGTVWLLDAPGLYDRPGGPYQDTDGRDHGDNWRRFALLAQAAARIAGEGAEGWTPDAVHGHDWQAGLVPAYLRAGGCDVPSVQTIHNIAFAGQFPAGIFGDLGLPAGYYDMEGVEFHGGVSFLKAGLHFADAITTVSPTYAEELTRPEFGHGFDGLLRARAGDFTGILNGIDTGEWDPGADPLIERRYSSRSMGRRAANRRALCTAFALDGERPLVSVISRLTHQKGIDVIFDAADDIVARGFNLIVLGAGDAELETAAHDLAMRHAGRIGVHVGYDEALAHRIQAGADALLVPSRFEPCGLTQLCALRYGALPVVAPTGGLIDSVIDATPASLDAGVATGIHLREVSARGIGAALGRLAEIMAEPNRHARMMRNAMGADVSWSSSAGRYAALYAGLVDGRRRIRESRAASAAKRG